MSSKYLFAAMFLAGTMFTPVASSAQDRGVNDFGMVLAAVPDDDDEEDEEEQADEQQGDDEEEAQADEQQGDDEQGDDDQSAGRQASRSGYADNVSDLDSLSAEDLNQELNDELDDVFQSIGTDRLVSIDEAYEAVMVALSDDDDDPSESIIDFNELEAEMAEAETSIEDEVMAALNEADQSVMRAPPGVYNVASQDFHLVGPDGRTTGRASFGAVKQRFTRDIRYRR